MKACNISPFSKDEKKVINDLVAKVREDNPSLAPEPAKGVKANDLDNTINLAAQIAFKVVKASEKVTYSNLTSLANKLGEVNFKVDTQDLRSVSYTHLTLPTKRIV